MSSSYNLLSFLKHSDRLGEVMFAPCGSLFVVFLEVLKFFELFKLIGDMLPVVSQSMQYIYLFGRHIICFGILVL